MKKTKTYLPDEVERSLVSASQLKPGDRIEINGKINTISSITPDSPGWYEIQLVTGEVIRSSHSVRVLSAPNKVDYTGIQLQGRTRPQTVRGISIE